MAKDERYGWAPPRNKWPAQCKPHRDGWVRWYKDKTRFVCSKNVPLDEVENRWIAKKAEIDDAERGTPKIGRHGITYRQALSEFLNQCELRVKTGKPRSMAPRTLHNYETDLNNFGNFIGGGMLLKQVGPEQFTAYAKKISHLKASGFDSIVCRVGALFNWAVEMEYIDRYRPGPAFQRPEKKEMRHQRIGRKRSFTADEVAKLWKHANNVTRCWIGLGICAAFINSDIANLPRECIDLAEGVVDFRRRKTGKIRRVCPLPEDVLVELRQYERPEPTAQDHAGLFFISEMGNPYAQTRKLDGKPTNTISRLFARLLETTKVSTVGDGRNFAGLRTTFYNIAPKSGYETERAIIMGRAQGTVDLDHYLEDVGLDRLRHVVSHVWSQISTALANLDRSHASESPAA